MDLLRNMFVQGIGVGAVVFILLRAFDWIMIFLLGTLESFSQWYRFYASPYAWEIALGAAVVWVIGWGVFSSRRN